MTPDEWSGLGAGLVLAMGAGALARLGLEGGGLAGSRPYAFECPRFREDVECRVRQNVRTGQWEGVLSCSAFVEPEKLLCDRECARMSNLGLLRLKV
jgi:hypothetical protein